MLSNLNPDRSAFFRLRYQCYKTSDLFLMVSFHLSRRVCVAILRHDAESSCWRARATLQQAAVVHAVNAVLSDGLDKFFCTKAITIVDNFKKALGDTDNR